MTALGLVRLDRQMPVGVFDGPPSRARAIFTGGKSAIDLVGLGADDALWLLELKTSRNIRVGALSKLFFYPMVLNDACQGRIGFICGPDVIIVVAIRNPGRRVRSGNGRYTSWRAPGPRRLTYAALPFRHARQK